MTFLELQQELLALRFASDKLTSIKHWLNHAYAILWGLENWTFRYAQEAATITSGSQTVGGLTADVRAVNRFYDDSRNPLIYLREREFYDNYDNVMVGTPEVYTVMNGVVTVAPIPNVTSSSYLMLYVKKLTLLVADSDVPLIPEEFHYLLIPGALSMGLAVSNDFTFQFQAGAWQEGLQSMRREYLSETSAEPLRWARDVLV